MEPPALSFLAASFNSASATICRNQQADACYGEKAAVDGPLRLASHEAARKNVDSLKNPDAPHEETQDADDVQYDAHLLVGNSCEAIM
jgi:hypothetical protein